MKLILCTGNIGDKYCFNRHNVGFMVADKMAIDEGFDFKLENKLKCYLAKYQDFIIIKPTTYMNLSGEALSLVMNYYKIKPEDVLIVYDDLAIDLGTLRFKGNGSDGGHNGIKSIIQHLGTNKFARLKVGIGPQPPIPSENFVLGNFSKEQMSVLKEVLTRAVEAIKFYFENGLEKAQNKYN